MQIYTHKVTNFNCFYVEIDAAQDKGDGRRAFIKPVSAVLPPRIATR
jgi:hypothetical protein